MSYPPPYQATTDFSRDEQDQRPVDGVKLAVELANIGESINQMRDFLRAGFTSDKKWQPASALAMKLLEVEPETASVGQTEFDLPNGATADTNKDHVQVWVDGLLLDPDDVTLNATNVQIPAQTGGERVVIALYNDADSIRTDLAATTANLGASLVGLEDVLDLFSATDVEGALAELKARVEDLITQIGDLSGLIRADGSVDFTANQNMGGNRLVGLADGVSPQDAATVAQLSALSAIYGDLNTVYLRLAGGVMSGNIDMGDNFVLNVKDAVQAGDAVNKRVLDALETSLRQDLLPRNGSLPWTGSHNADGNKLTNLADGEDDQDAATVSQVSELIQQALDNESFLFVGGMGTDGDEDDTATLQALFNAQGSGLYEFDQDLTIDSPLTLPPSVIIRVKGNLTVSAEVTSRVPVDFQESIAHSSSIQNGVDWARQGGNNANANGNARRYLRWTTKHLLCPRAPLSAWGGALIAVGAEQAVSGGGGAYGNGGSLFIGAGGSGGSFPGSIAHSGLLDPRNVPGGSSNPTRSSRWWQNVENIWGGPGGGGKLGGGSVIFMVDGNVVMTGGTINCSGEDGAATEADPSTAQGGGGGGSIIIITQGTMTDGTLKAGGGFGNRNTLQGDESGGGGGGGLIQVVARLLAGTINADASGGNGNYDNFVDVSAGSGGRCDIFSGAGSVSPTVDVSRGVTKDGAGADQSASFPYVVNGVSVSATIVPAEIPQFFQR